jgi:hypothetical protein
MNNSYIYFDGLDYPELDKFANEGTLPENVLEKVKEILVRENEFPKEEIILLPKRVRKVMTNAEYYYSALYIYYNGFWAGWVSFQYGDSHITLFPYLVHNENMDAH